MTIAANTTTMSLILFIRASCVLVQRQLITAQPSPAVCKLLQVEFCRTPNPYESRPVGSSTTIVGWGRAAAGPPPMLLDVIQLDSGGKWRIRNHFLRVLGRSTGSYLSSPRPFYRKGTGSSFRATIAHNVKAAITYVPFHGEQLKLKTACWFGNTKALGICVEAVCRMFSLIGAGCLD